MIPIDSIDVYYIGSSLVPNTLQTGDMLQVSCLFGTRRSVSIEYKWLHYNHSINRCEMDCQNDASHINYQLSVLALKSGCEIYQPSLDYRVIYLTLHINDVTIHDAGEYKCIANDTFENLPLAQSATHLISTG